jgi:hypothetical protein
LPEDRSATVEVNVESQVILGQPIRGRLPENLARFGPFHLDLVAPEPAAELGLGAIGQTALCTGLVDRDDAVLVRLKQFLDS